MSGLPFYTGNCCYRIYYIVTLSMKVGSYFLPRSCMHKWSITAQLLLVVFSLHTVGAKKHFRFIIILQSKYFVTMCYVHRKYASSTNVYASILMQLSMFSPTTPPPAWAGLGKGWGIDLVNVQIFHLVA